MKKLKKFDEDSLKKVEEFCRIRNLSPSTTTTYMVALRHYSQVNEMTIQELLDEADAEEEEGVRWKHRKLKQRLIKYQNYLSSTYNYQTCLTYMTRVKSFYYENEIEIHKLPPINKLQAKVSKPLGYEDLPTKQNIKDAYNIAPPVIKAYLLFAISSGCARTECLNFTIADYHEWIEPFSVSQILEDDVDIIPVIHVKRQKTNKHYFTFCSSEAVKEIAKYLQTRKDDNPQLFKIGKKYIGTKLHEINQQLGLGLVNDTAVLRTHTLRKFHASQLHSSENALTMDEIDALQGRCKESTRQSYYFDNPNDLKEKYLRNMGQVTIFTEVNMITVDSEEVAELKKKVAKLDELEALVKKILEKNKGIGE